MKKRILAFLLTGAMLLGTVSTEAYAAVPQEPVGVVEDSQKDFDEQPEETDTEKIDAQKDQTAEKTTEIGKESTEKTDEDLAEREADEQAAQEETENEANDEIEPPNIEQDAKSGESTNTDQEIEAAKENQAQQQSAEDEGIQEVPSADEEAILNWTPPVDGLQMRELEVPDEVRQTAVSVEDSDLAGIDGLDHSVKGSQSYDSSWDVYSSNYLYNRLDANKREFWDRLNKV